MGSISHDGDLCLATVDVTGRTVSIGVDIVRIQRLPEGVAELVCSEKDDSFLSSVAASSCDPYLIAFSLKEAIFKCLHVFWQRIVDFREVWLVRDEAGSAVRIGMHNDIGGFGGLGELESQFAVVGSYLLTAAWLRSLRRIEQ